MAGHGWAATPDLKRRVELRSKSGLCEYVCMWRVVVSSRWTRIDPAPLCEEFASEAKIYSEWPPDGVLVLLKLIFWLSLFSLLMRADISWEEQSMPGKMVGPREQRV